MNLEAILPYSNKNMQFHFYFIFLFKVLSVKVLKVKVLSVKVLSVNILQHANKFELNNVLTVFTEGKKLLENQ